LTGAYQTTAFVLMENHNAAGALPLYRKSLEIGEALLATNPTSALFRRNVYSSHWGLGLALRTSGDIGGGLNHHRKPSTSPWNCWARSQNTQARTTADAHVEYANHAEGRAKRPQL
jgi:hypothetical protein